MICTTEKFYICIRISIGTKTLSQMVPFQNFTFALQFEVVQKLGPKMLLLCYNFLWYQNYVQKCAISKFHVYFIICDGTKTMSKMVPPETVTFALQFVVVQNCNLKW